VKIGGWTAGGGVLIVAEIGNNHEGRFDVAERLVNEAAACGVDAVKFQTFQTEHYVSRSDQARFARLKSFELGPEVMAKLAELARSLGLVFLSTPFDLESARRLEPLVDAYKVASGDLLFYPLLAEVARTGRPVVLSSGGSDVSRTAAAVAFLRDQWRGLKVDPGVAVLHCVSCYPVPPEQANLRAIQSLAAQLQLPVGYSDHTVGIDAALTAVALGASIVEKHFTLDRQFSDFRDHQLSADPADMRELVRRCRLVEAMLGDRDKRLQACEEPGIKGMRRSIVAASDLPSGHRLELTDLTWVRPAGGLPPGEEHRLIGKVLARSVTAGDRLNVDDLA
jgi:sialic acid synthase SpsE